MQQEMWEMSSQVDASNRRYTVHHNQHHNNNPHNNQHQHINPGTEDLHAWSIYRQNLNSDFTDSALGSEERSPLPYGNFQLREQTVQSILRHPRLAPRSELANNMYAYLKFGLPRVFPPGGPSGFGSKGGGGGGSDIHALDSVSVSNANNARSGGGGGGMRGARSETDLVLNLNNGGGPGHHGGQNGGHPMGLISNRFKKPSRAISESNLLREGGDQHGHGHTHMPMTRPMSKAGSQVSSI